MMILNEEVLANQDGGFDFVYTDGSHEADDTFLDAELAWRLTRLGGLIILDDYRWDKEPVSSMHHPARGIDAFITLHEGQLELLHKGSYAKLLKCVSDFCLNRSHCIRRNRISSRTLNMASMLLLNSYAMTGTVALRFDATSGRMTFYIIDCRLQPEEKHKLEASIPQERADEVSLMFQPLPPGSQGMKEPT